MSLKAEESKRQRALRKSLLAPDVVRIAERKYRQFTMGALPLAEEMGLSIFLPAPEGEPAPPVSENEEIRQMAAFAWAHDVENDLFTEVLPSLEDGSWKIKAKAYLLQHFSAGEYFSLFQHMAEFQTMVREATVIVAKRSGRSAGESAGE